MKTILMLCVLLLACESPAELEKRQREIVNEENGRAEPFKTFSNKWCKEIHGTDCTGICRTNVWGTEAKCDVVIDGSVKHLDCNGRGCVEQVLIRSN